MDDLDVLEGYLKERAHTFQAIRKHTSLKYSDAKFEEVIQKNPHRFVSQDFVRRDVDGNRVKPNRRGIKLKPQAEV